MVKKITLWFFITQFGGDIMKKTLPISLTILYFISFLLPATAVSNPKNLETLVVNYFEVIKENPLNYTVLIILVVALAFLYKNKRTATLLYVTLVVSYLWVTLPNAIELFTAFSKVYGYYITMVLGMLAILAFGFYIMDYHKKMLPSTKRQIA